MPLALVPGEAADALRVAGMEHDAYASNVFTPIIFPGPFPDDVLDMRAAELADDLRTNPTTRWWKVVDTDVGRDGASSGGGPANDDHIIAFASWNVYETPLPVPPPARRVAGHGINAAAFEALFGGQSEQRERLMGGKPYMYLRYLLTDPKHQRRGAGRLLVQWGLDEAGRLGLPAYLHATEAGHGLYLSLGLKDVEKLDIDLAEFGAAGVHTTWAMRKDP